MWNCVLYNVFGSDTTLYPIQNNPVDPLFMNHISAVNHFKLRNTRWVRIYIPIAIIIVLIITMIIHSYRVTTNFYRNPSNSIIINRSNWQLRSTSFYLDNGIQIDSFSNFKFDLKIGDSIVKKAQSKKFDVYRKNGAFKYQLIHAYIYDTKTYSFFHPEIDK